MTIIELREKALNAIENIKNRGEFLKENDTLDYKMELNHFNINDNIEIFLKNFLKDIISFSNLNGGIIFIGFKEYKTTGKVELLGLCDNDLQSLSAIDMNNITQKFESIVKVGVSIDLQPFQIIDKQCYYLLIGKQNQILVPSNDYDDYKIKKGEIYYRGSGKNETANKSTSDFNKFIQLKASEKNKEFMEIWSKLLPEMFEINPREVLIINPRYNKVYGFNGKSNILSSSDIEIDKSEDGVFNIILQAISAGEIGKISDTEGKPLYKIVGEIKKATPRHFISISTLMDEIKMDVKYNFTANQLKAVMSHLGWVNDKSFAVENKKNDDKFADIVNKDFVKYVWIEHLDKIQKIVFSNEAKQPLVGIINDLSRHNEIFGKKLNLKSTK